MATATARLGHALALELFGRFALAPEVLLVLEVLLKVPRLAIELELRVLGLLARDPLDVLADVPAFPRQAVVVLRRERVKEELATTTGVRVGWWGWDLDDGELPVGRAR